MADQEVASPSGSLSEAPIQLADLPEAMMGKVWSKYVGHVANALGKAQVIEMLRHPIDVATLGCTSKAFAALCQQSHVWHDFLQRHKWTGPVMQPTVTPLNTPPARFAWRHMADRWLRAGRYTTLCPPQAHHHDWISGLRINRQRGCVVSCSVNCEVAVWCGRWLVQRLDHQPLLQVPEWHAATFYGCVHAL